jgi:transcriptional regulator of met regulon
MAEVREARRRGAVEAFHSGDFQLAAQLFEQAIAAGPGPDTADLYERDARIPSADAETMRARVFFTGGNRAVYCGYRCYRWGTVTD